MNLSPRRATGPVLGLTLAILTAGALLATATADTWLGLLRPWAPGDVAPVTLRGRDDAVPGVLVHRGDKLTPDEVVVVGAHGARPVDLHDAQRLGAALLAIAILVVWLLRATHQGRRRRALATALGLWVALAVGVKAMLLVTAISPHGAPVAALGILGAAVLGRGAGIALAAGGAFTVACLGAPDPLLAVALFVQGAGGALAVSARPKRGGALVLAGLGAALAGAAAYAALAAVRQGEIPIAELAHPLDSAWAAAAAGGLVGGLLAALGRGVVERLAGDLPRSTLQALADLDHPLLRRIAVEAPGTWQHSLAMANLAEIAANAIGANALLVRVGAYFHDLGKSLQPPYYIENLAPGQPSPHDALPPEMSADAIFAHVTEGVRLGREEGLPERIIDFMHMHHGDSVLEYFWGRCQEQGNPNGLSETAFRYPGVKPQSKETAILCLCDAVEAGSRTLPRGDTKAIDTLVSRIVTIKLRQGQLDESGLTLAELRLLSDTLVDTLRHAGHARIEYPWQKEAAATQNLRSPPPAATVTQEVAAPPPKPKLVVVDAKDDDVGRALREDE